VSPVYLCPEDEGWDGLSAALAKSMDDAGIITIDDDDEDNNGKDDDDALDWSAFDCYVGCN
jgi:hypothetical protein